MAWRSVSLSQLMHKREAGLGPLEDIPHMRDEPALQFDWEESIEISARARRALDFLARETGRAKAVDAATGQQERDWPLWPTRLRARGTGRARVAEAAPGREPS